MAEPTTLEELFADAQTAVARARPPRTFKTKDKHLVEVADTQFYLRPSRVRVADLPRKPDWAILQFPAPSRMSMQVTRDGLWYDTRWTLEGVQSVIESGGWFQKGHHEFDCKSTAEVAYRGKADGPPISVKLTAEQLLAEFWAESSAALPFKSMQG